MASDEHQILVKKIIDNFISKGLEIQCASYEGYQECAKEGRHEPDVRAYDRNNSLVYIGEAKTCDDIHNDHTREQLQDYSNRTMDSNGLIVPFFIAIPKICVIELAKELTALRLGSNRNIIILDS